MKWGATIERGLAVLTALFSNYVLDLLTRRFVSRWIVAIIVLEIMIIWNVIDPTLREWLTPDVLIQQRMRDNHVPAALIAELTRRRIRRRRSTVRGLIAWAADDASLHWQRVLTSLMDFAGLLAIYIIFQIILAIATAWGRETPNVVETVFGAIIVLIIAFSVLERINELDV